MFPIDRLIDRQEQSPVEVAESVELQVDPHYWNN